MKTFGFSHNELLQLPIRQFWFYNKQVDRLKAEEGLHLIQLLASATSEEAYGSMLERLTETMGEIAVVEPTITSMELDGGIDPEFDRAGLHALKGMSRVV